MGSLLKITMTVISFILGSMIRIHRGILRGVSPARILLPSIQRFRTTQPRLLLPISSQAKRKK